MTIRTHPTLTDLIRCETMSPTPKQTAAAMKEQTPHEATHAVLYKDRRGIKWHVEMVPNSKFHSVAKALQSRHAGLPAVATCELAPTPEKQGSRDRRHL